MERLVVYPDNPHSRNIDKAVQVLNSGGLIIHPTDTVYGIGCNLYNKKALEQLYRLKKKSKFDPVSIIFEDIRMASKFAKISNHAYRVLRHCLPGPYTFILPATREIPRIMLSRRKEVGIRIPDCNISQTLVSCLDMPVVNTSVNLNADEVLNDPDEIADRFQNGVDLMLDAGWLPDAMESTVASLISDEVEVLREGKGNMEKLFEK